MSAEPSRSQKTWNTQARRAVLAEFGAVRVSDLPAGMSVLAVLDENSERVCPAFQFTPDAKLLPVVREIIAIFDAEDMSDWQKALWFTTPTGWLHDQRPVDLLDTQPDAVVAAARDLSARPFF